MKTTHKQILALLLALVLLLSLCACVQKTQTEPNESRTSTDKVKMPTKPDKKTPEKLPEEAPLQNDMNAVGFHILQIVEHRMQANIPLLCLVAVSPNKDLADERNFRWQTLYAILKRLERRCADILRDLGLKLEKYNMLCHCCFLIYQCEYSKILSWSAELTAPVMLEKRTNHPQAHSKIFSTNRDTG